MSRMLAQENVRADVGQRGGADETDQEAAKASGEGPERSDHWNLCSEEVHISSGGGNSQFYCWGPIDFDLIVKLFLVSKKARKRSACPAKRRLWPAPWKLPKHVGRSWAKLILIHWNSSWLPYSTYLHLGFFMLSRRWRPPICGSKKFEPQLRPGGSR